MEFNMTKDEAIHKALKVLNCLNNDRVYETAWVKGAINACEEALAQEERTQRTMYCGTADAFIAMDDDHKRRWFVQSLRESKRRKELEDILEQPAQEPVAYIEYAWVTDKDGLWTEEKRLHDYDNGNCKPLYTHPASSWQGNKEFVGLSDEEIFKCEADAFLKMSHDTWELDFYGYARAIEQALKEKNNAV